MSKTLSRWELDEIEISSSAQGAALRVVERATREKRDVIEQWETAVRLAHANGASLRDIAAVAGASPQTISKICKL
ncbi:MAG: helix-turn-helix domain-containing protein [Acidimicrobiia bacterium]|nr:helix-turn-helix domain-containing protein [Acidimicrobiia bacterium]MXZ84458.1 helix-turn-helix domain-containing protein [Acidimicrobiia bacterium]MYB08504.1 helix-turn-helix domain-containing protein [Acidimicrobiia bacterium]MYG57776.1 helix-turn-helix domain-containing protein [Acidimicrobiia bacterium]MYJ33335.1 helix-turn-helix domain-containing protein [Acidimicrobiia bacterium]